MKKAFNNDHAFSAALDKVNRVLAHVKACRTVVNENSVNKDSTKSPELLAKYCDFLLKKGTGKIIEESALDAKLNDIVNRFFYSLKRL